MKLLGAEVVQVESRSKTLKDALNEAMRDCDERREHLLYHRHRRRPAPVSDDGARLPVGDRQGGSLPDHGIRRPAARSALFACVGGGLNAMGLFHPFVDDAE